MTRAVDFAAGKKGVELEVVGGCTLWKQFAPRRFRDVISIWAVDRDGRKSGGGGGEEEDVVPNNFPILRRIPADGASLPSTPFILPVKQNRAGNIHHFNNERGTRPNQNLIWISSRKASLAPPEAIKMGGERERERHYAVLYE